MKEQFRTSLHLGKKNITKLNIVNSIIEEYLEQGYKLTLRQLYYQLVSRDLIPNTVQEYAKLSTLLVKGRMAGVVDWDAIEDRIRVPYLPYWVYGIDDAIEDTIDSYRLDRQKDQDTYIELWIEKDALSGVLKKVTSYYHLNLMVNRGYSSCTAIHDAYRRFKNQTLKDKESYILYLGDHDPSGLDMIRDIKERIAEFGIDINIKSIALTAQQIKKYSPPSNPAKITDPRAKWYIQRFGNVSWEVDALTPDVLHKTVKKSVEKIIDMKLFNKVKTQEETDKKELTNIRRK